VGMFVIAGAAALFASHVSNGRRLLLEARLEQDLRSAADLVTRDLRRAGFWQNALGGTFAGGASSVTTVNPYATVSAIAVAAAGIDPAASQVTYSFSRDTTENNALDNNEQFGFRLSGGALQMQLGSGNWQPVTDPALVQITAFSIEQTATPFDSRSSCARPCCTSADVAAAVPACPSASSVTLTSGNCPTVLIRQYDITITGRSLSDAMVTRSLQTRVRVRNDSPQGTCPA
jgi:prepilin peptidase dependent protein B